MEGNEIDRLKNLGSPSKSEERSSLSEDFAKQKSSSHSDDKKKKRENSLSSVSSTTSIIRVTKNESIEGLHTFNLKQYASGESSDVSADSRSQSSVKSSHNKS